jgi:hypothetical protein
MRDALATLLVDEEDLAEDEITRALRPYVRLTRSGELVPEPRFDQISTEHRVLCVLLAVQALHMLGIRRTATVTPAQVVSLSAMPDGTVRPKLSALRKARVLTKRGSEYELPLSRVRHAVRVLESESYG